MNLGKNLLAEFLGTSGLLIVIVGSGIMAENLSQGNKGIVLLANSLATGAGLYALILTFSSISGAHFNPIVSFIEYLWKKLTLKEFGLYSLAQVFGAILGVFATHAMFGHKILQLSKHNRDDFHFFLSEMIATFGLMIVISLSGKKNVQATPAAISFFIMSAYWCTSSTSFANPAVTLARSLTDSFSGILWTGVPAFILAQAIGAVLAFFITKIFSERAVENLSLRR